MVDIYFSQIDIEGLTRGQISSLEHKFSKKLLAHVLTNFYGKSEPLPSTELTDSGKPYLSDHSLEFNISHSYGKVVLAISDKPVGVDIEHTDRSVPEIVCRRFFDKTEATVEEWTKFESYSKLLGDGIYGVSYPPRNGEAFFKTYRPIENYVISVCSVENVFPERITFLDFPE